MCQSCQGGFCGLVDQLILWNQEDRSRILSANLLIRALYVTRCHNKRSIDSYAAAGMDVGRAEPDSRSGGKRGGHSSYCNCGLENQALRIAWIPLPVSDHALRRVSPTLGPGPVG